MTETKTKRRGWVKNAAIIFLAVLLVLTFFSNTFLNRSLPEVAAQYPTSGSIDLKIRGDGLVSSNQVEKVTIAESRKVKGVAIRAGDEVTEGQALFLLADTESAELEAASTLLEDMELAYAKKLLDATVTDDGTDYDLLKAQIALEEAMERQEKARLYDVEREPLEKAVQAAADALAAAIDNADQLPEKAVLDNAKETLELAKAAQEKAKTDFDYYASLHGVGEYAGLADKLETLNTELEDLWEQLDDVDVDIDELEEEKRTAERTVSDAKNVLEATIQEAADSYLDSPKPVQQLEEIGNQYAAAKNVWDTLVSKYYYECVDIENRNTSFTANAVLTDKQAVGDYPGVGRKEEVIVFVTSEDFSGNDVLVQEILNANADNTDALTWAYRSMVWWHMTYDAAQAYDEAVSSDNRLESIETELETQYDKYDNLWDQIQDKEDEFDEQKAILNDPELSNAYEDVLYTNEAVKLANDAVYDAQLAYDNAAKSPAANVEQAQAAYDKAKEQLDALSKGYEGVGSYADEKKNVLSAQQALEAIYKNQTLEDIDAQKADLDLQKELQALEEQRAKVEELQKNASETIIYAPCSGTVVAVNVAAGDTTIMNEAMAEIELTDQGHILTFEVTKEQAAKVKVGDQAEVADRWGVDIRATLASIGNSKTNPGGSKLLTFDLKGEDVVPGQSLTLSVGSKSQSYEVIVPNSAIRQDATGKFVLVVTSKNTPLGNRYYVNRIDVEVLASDDNNSAVKGMLTIGEFVVITSTAPLSSGDQVRLPE